MTVWTINVKIAGLIASTTRTNDESIYEAIVAFLNSQDKYFEVIVEDL